MLLEILISTMNRTDFSFLENMFINNNIGDFQILIINQTSKEHILKPKSSNIRVINSFEKGLSKSRNLAIKNAIGDICLLADDDVKYLKDFREVVLEAFNKFKKADIMTFQMVDERGRLFKDYPDILKHNKKTVITVNSVVIAFKRDVLELNSVRFNEYFGLGSTFQTADEYIFLRNALNVNLNIYFKNNVILSHKFYSSGKAIGSDRIVFAKGALFYKYSNILAYPRLLKYLLFDFKNNYITYKQIWPKYLVGLRGIGEYKRLVKMKLLNH